MKKLFLNGPFSPHHTDNLMHSEGDLSEARENFISRRFRNLDVLLSSRYSWMNDYLSEGQKIIEIGSGAGFSQLYLKQTLTLTDATQNSWIEKFIDATDMELDDNSHDVIIASHNIHHFYSPYKFFMECQRVLKPGGVILIQELNTSLMLRFLLKIMRHEGWSYDKDVFDEDAIMNSENDLWSANCAVPEMLFSQASRFNQTFEKLTIERNQLCECFIFPLSGGVIAKTRVPELPKFILDMVLLLDKILIKILPSVFALGRQVVIRKGI